MSSTATLLSECTRTRLLVRVAARLGCAQTVSQPRPRAYAGAAVAAACGAVMLHLAAYAGLACNPCCAVAHQ